MLFFSVIQIAERQRSRARFTASLSNALLSILFVFSQSLIACVGALKTVRASCASMGMFDDSYESLDSQPM